MQGLLSEQRGAEVNRIIILLKHRCINLESTTDLFSATSAEGGGHFTLSQSERGLLLGPLHLPPEEDVTSPCMHNSVLCQLKGDSRLQPIPPPASAALIRLIYLLSWDSCNWICTTIGWLMRLLSSGQKQAGVFWPFKD